jgi:serine/threonine-protein kinase PRP4
VKPDNILSSNNNKTVKLCDFGTALYTDEANLVDYMQSRYYRAPEIVLGSPYDFAIDIWSAACTIYELFTGKILFQGKNNTDMLKLMMAVKGRFSYRYSHLQDC